MIKLLMPRFHNASVLIAGALAFVSISNLAQAMAPRFQSATVTGATLTADIVGLPITSTPYPVYFDGVPAVPATKLVTTTE